MKILSINPVYNLPEYKTSKEAAKPSDNKLEGLTNCYYMPSFCSVEKLTPQFVLKKRSHLLPERVLNKLKEVCENPPEVMPNIKAIHFAAYEKLFYCKTLNRAKKWFPEFKDVIDAKEIENNPSSAISSIKSRMKIEDLSLSLLKDLYSFKKEDGLVEKYGLTNRSQLIWLLGKLNIPKLNGNYLMIVKLLDEKVNAKFAKNAHKTLRTNPEVEKRRIASILKTVKTDEYRSRRRIEARELLENNPHLREDTRLVSQITWDRCPEIRQAFSDYTKEQAYVVRKALTKKKSGEELSDVERNLLCNYYKSFWDSHPDLREKYSRIRHEVTEELKAQGLVK